MRIEPSGTVKKDKDDLRRKYIAVREEMDEGEKAKRDAAICSSARAP